MASEDRAPGDVVELEVGPVAHGGHCVARLRTPGEEGPGRVVFVRHALPGERVRARLTETGAKARFWRADAVEVLEASPDRVPSAWPEAGPGGVGGGELAHVSPAAQRAWKAAVLGEQLQRLARVERDVPVRELPGDAERGGLGWRTRVGFLADREGRAGMRRFRSHDVVPVSAMPLMSDALAGLDLLGRRWRPGARIEAVAPAGGDQPVVLVDGEPFDLRRGKVDPRPNARTAVRERVRVGDREWAYRVAAAGFWQVHREAPAALTGAVLDAAGDVAGARVLDLYSGAGLFTLPLADAVGDAGTVVAVEGDARAVKDARRNLHDRPQVALHGGDVAGVLASGEAGPRADVVVLDPPRVGAGRDVVRAVAGLAPERVVYVACDPAALARDVAYLAEEGYALADVTGYDLFPMTHHVEAVAVLTR
ncbi:TRAM domain-containing protein [Cellulomonas sp. ES6]|uniref:class I SAM-dependent RNA methyltransferase n=1 Tax=Cellulomonas sp. ES6 TaxID=3039384 RepID=UPI0019AD2023|nr:TRAM domain-containing protein [Cellulomonas sp. ES6]MBD3779077.1 class I SAM-dependent RNA methyltransferase [Micrococcales bacterium]WHP18078.1 TRAM domain-containing protein [Cellulomonas sp. ES6]